MAINSIKRLLQLYGGPGIPGLWRFSRESARRPAGLYTYLYELLPPGHSLSGHFTFRKLPAGQIRDMVRRAIRLNEIDPRLKVRRGGEGHPPLSPFARFDEDYPLGDRLSLKCQRGIPFSIVVDRTPFDRLKSHKRYTAIDLDVIERWGEIPESEKERILRAFFEKLNDDFKYLSGGRFSLRLQGIRFVDQLPKSKDNEANSGFTLYLPSPSDKESKAHGRYFGQGRFYLPVAGGLFRNDTRDIYVGMAMHEIMHGLFGLGHNDGLGRGTLFNQHFSAGIKLHRLEAEFLGWPIRPPISTVVNEALAA